MEVWRLLSNGVIMKIKQITFNTPGGDPTDNTLFVEYDDESNLTVTIDNAGEYLELHPERAEADIRALGWDIA